MSPTPATGDPRLVLLPAVDVVDGQAVRLSLYRNCVPLMLLNLSLSHPLQR